MTLIRILLLTLFLMANAFAENDSQKSAVVEIPTAIADSLPWFAVREVNGTHAPFTKSHLSKLANVNERVALVYFATWCSPCREGVKRLADARDQLAENKVGVVLVNIGESDESQIQKWLDKLGASSFKVVVDPYKRMTENFGIIGAGEEMVLPKTLVVDSRAKPVILIGQEGNDWPEILWKE